MKKFLSIRIDSKLVCMDSSVVYTMATDRELTIYSALIRSYLMFIFYKNNNKIKQLKLPQALFY